MPLPYSSLSIPPPYPPSGPTCSLTCNTCFSSSAPEASPPAPDLCVPVPRGLGLGAGVHPLSPNTLLHLLRHLLTPLKVLDKALSCDWQGRSGTFPECSATADIWLGTAVLPPSRELTLNVTFLAALTPSSGAGSANPARLDIGCLLSGPSFPLYNINKRGHPVLVQCTFMMVNGVKLSVGLAGPPR